MENKKIAAMAAKRNGGCRGKGEELAVAEVEREREFDSHWGAAAYRKTYSRRAYASKSVSEARTSGSSCEQSHRAMVTAMMMRSRQEL